MPDDLVTILGRLLCDADVRRRFLADRRAFTATLQVDDAAAATLLSMDATALEQQSRALISKRWSEVRRLVPRTVALLGDRARAVFTEYASSHWPSTHRRHWCDAAAFCIYLRAQDPHSLVQAESARVRFMSRRRRLQISLLSDFTVCARRHFAVQVLVHRRGSRRLTEHIWCLRWPSLGERQRPSLPASTFQPRPTPPRHGPAPPRMS